MVKHTVFLELWPESRTVSFTLRNTKYVSRKDHQQALEDWALYNYYEKTGQGKNPHWKARRMLESGETAQCDIVIQDVSYEEALMTIGEMRAYYRNAGWRVKYAGPKNFRK